jgi:hypothetical protein
MVHQPEFLLVAVSIAFAIDLVVVHAIGAAQVLSNGQTQTVTSVAGIVSADRCLCLSLSLSVFLYLPLSLCLSVSPFFV